MSTSVRRTLTGLAATVWLASTSLVLAAPATAEVPAGWPDADPINRLGALLVLGGIPLLLFVVITVAVYVPSLRRGEPIAPGSPRVEDQWLGGPRHKAGELTSAGAETAETSGSGGASGRW